MILKAILCVQGFSSFGAMLFIVNLLIKIKALLGIFAMLPSERKICWAQGMENTEECMLNMYH